MRAQGVDTRKGRGRRIGSINPASDKDRKMDVFESPHFVELYNAGMPLKCEIRLFIFRPEWNNVAGFRRMFCKE
jgi:hypothetical protein